MPQGYIDLQKENELQKTVKKSQHFKSNLPEFATAVNVIKGFPSMKVTLRRRITVTSSLNEIATLHNTQ